MKNDIEDIDKEFNENISNVFEINENDLEIELLLEIIILIIN